MGFVGPKVVASRRACERRLCIPGYPWDCVLRGRGLARRCNASPLFDGRHDERLDAADGSTPSDAGLGNDFSPTLRVGSKTI